MPGKTDYASTIRKPPPPSVRFSRESTREAGPDAAWGAENTPALFWTKRPSSRHASAYERFTFKGEATVKRELGVIGLLLAVTAVPVAELRTWTFEKSGKTIQAEVVNFVGTNLVTLKGADGKTFSVPIAYLTATNRAYLAAERAAKWKEVEVVRLEGTASGGRYKKCSVRAKDMDDVVLVDLLPPAVETILKNPESAGAEIAELQSWIKSNAQGLTRSTLLCRSRSTTGGHDTNAVYRVKDMPRSKSRKRKPTCPGLKQPIPITTPRPRRRRLSKMKKTSLVYEGLPVWECFDPRKRQQ